MTENDDEEEDASFGYQKWSVDRHSRMRSGSSVNSKDPSSTPGYLLRDYSSFLGESPMFLASGLCGSSVPRYSNLELVKYLILIIISCYVYTVLVV